jgi:hypothetical protein
VLRHQPLKDNNFAGLALRFEPFLHLDIDI